MGDKHHLPSGSERSQTPKKRQTPGTGTKGKTATSVSNSGVTRKLPKGEIAIGNVYL